MEGDMAVYIVENCFGLYVATSMIICLMGWLLTRVGIDDHLVFFCRCVGKNVSWTAFFIVLGMFATRFTTYKHAESMFVTAFVIIIAVSLKGLLNDMENIVLMWEMYKRFEVHVTKNISEISREKYVNYANRMMEDDLFRGCEKYFSLFEADVYRLAVHIGICGRGERL